MIPAYVITIPRLQQRRGIFARNWTDRLKYHWHQGYDFKEIAAHVPKNRYAQKAMPQIAVAHSHFSLYDKLLETPEDRWLILEDDAEPTEHWDKIDWNYVQYAPYDVLKFFTMVLQPDHHTFEPDLLEKSDRPESYTYKGTSKAPPATS